MDDDSWYTAVNAFITLPPYVYLPFPASQTGAPSLSLPCAMPLYIERASGMMRATDNTAVHSSTVLLFRWEDIDS